MSYAPDFMPDARASWLALDVVLQEAVLDEIDRVAAMNAPPGRRWVHDFVLEVGGVRHYLFLELRVWLTSRTLKVYSVGHFFRPA